MEIWTRELHLLIIRQDAVPSIFLKSPSNLHNLPFPVP